MSREQVFGEVRVVTDQVGVVVDVGRHLALEDLVEVDAVEVHRVAQFDRLFC